MQLDLALFNAIHRFWGTNRFLDATGVFLANALTYILVLGMVFFIFWTAHTMRFRLLVAVEMLLAFLLARWMIVPILSAITERARPFKALGFEPPFIPITAGAFPSGHMAGIFSAAMIMATFDIRWGLAYMALGLVVGLARIFTGVHWPSDILAGIIVGLFGGLVVHFLARSPRETLVSQLPGAGSDSVAGVSGGRMDDIGAKKPGEN